MWTEIFVTQEDSIAEKLHNELKNVKIMARIVQGKGSYRILVPFSEVNEALNLIIDLNI